MEAEKEVVISKAEIIILHITIEVAMSLAAEVVLVAVPGEEAIEAAVDGLVVVAPVEEEEVDLTVIEVVIRPKTRHLILTIVIIETGFLRRLRQQRLQINNIWTAGVMEETWTEEVFILMEDTTTDASMIPTVLTMA